MKVRIFDLTQRISEYNDIKLIRIACNNYSQLILEDNAPICGEINGTFTINSNDIDLEYNNLIGYYIYRDKLFDLIIKETGGYNEI